MQILLLAASKASTQEAGADIKESSLLSDASNLEDGGLTSQSPPPPLIGDRGLLYGGEGNRTKRSGRGLQSSLQQTSTVRSVKASDGGVCIILAQLSRLHVILAP